ncbi:MAG: hypothetical protein FWC22_01885 [Treponema sp.]|nr:hypothetical protein [Treponema sp.]
MNESLFRMAETRYGIKADPDDIEKLKNHLLADGGSASNYDSIDGDNVLERFFSSGEAASFLTVNETYFFREPVHFSLLQEMLPSFNQSEIRICSAAASAGCEAYSIAMLLDMYNRTAEKPVFYQIDAFDINPNAIKAACDGIYNQNSLREDGSRFSYISDLYLKKNNYKVYVEQELKNNINFFVHNLLNELRVNYYDIIFFRNAFIYILPDYRERVLTNLSNALKENGILIMGVSETAAVTHHHLKQRIKKPLPQKEDVFFFQKNTYK